MFFSGKSKKCLNESEVGAVRTISRLNWLKLRLFCSLLPEKRLFSTSEGIYLGAVTVTKAGRNTRSAMRYPFCKTVTTVLASCSAGTTLIAW
jgi:hypothetical protein